jgi:hypothetical protein
MSLGLINPLLPFQFSVGCTMTTAGLREGKFAPGCAKYPPQGKRKPVWQVLPSLLYGQFRKVKVGRKLKQVYTKMLCGERSVLRTALQSIGLSGGIQTAYVERLNLTLRHLVAALRRKTWALAYSVRTLRWRVALAAAYYNFCRTHHALRMAVGEGRYRQRTPAMALGVTGHAWSVKEFITHPVY